MIQEEKDLLLKDLCRRQIYNVKCQVFNDVKPYILSGILHNKPYSQLYFEELDWKEFNGFVGIKDCKPYLFPLLSMTKEQESYLHFNTKFKTDRFGDLDVKIDEDDNYFYTDISDYVSIIDWLNKNHFDYRGLIENGLALDATGLNIY